MAEKTVKVAFYGKGGIGKSTIASNISAALAMSGRRVLHIGCDPKADSARCLTGQRIPTVLEQLNQLGEKLTRDDILYPGVYGVSCVEAGGPQAGAGCAGMGITAMEEELKRLGILEENWDVILYDVLGDVVCGGFAVPMRKRYVQRVYVVTSAELMALYAANNIMKGVRACSDREWKLMGGLIQNRCRSGMEREIAGAFAEKTETALLADIPESREIRMADYRKKTVMELYPDCEAAAVFRDLADRIAGGTGGSIPAVLDSEEMDRFGSWIFEKMGGEADGKI